MLSMKRDRSRKLKATVSETLSGNRTLNLAEMGRRWLFTVSAARDVTLPVFDPHAWVEIANDATSTNDITVKDNGGATVDTLSPGEGGRYAPGASGTIEPS